MDLRKLDWRFKRQLGFHFFELPLTCDGDLRLQDPLPARGAESVVAYLLDFFNFGGIAGRADRIFGNDGPSKTSLAL